jgi:hypothetical protein
VRKGSVLAALLTFSVLCACSQPARPSSLHSTSTTEATTTTAAPAATTTTTLPPFGARAFTVSGILLSGGDWLTVGLHPTTAPIEVQASASTALEVCPAGLDGGLNDSSWPPWFKFTECEVLSAARIDSLPPTDGATHVAFAIKAQSASAALSSLKLTVYYSATDSFVEVIPPETTSNTYMTVSVTPRSATVAASINPINAFTPAAGYSLDLMQAGRALPQSASCDFPTELTTCFGGIVPGGPVAVQVVGQGSPVVLNLGWK